MSTRAIFPLGSLKNGKEKYASVTKQGSLPVLSNTSNLFPGQGPAATSEPSSVELARKCSQN